MIFSINIAHFHRPVLWHRWFLYRFIPVMGLCVFASDNNENAMQTYKTNHKADCFAAILLSLIHMMYCVLASRVSHLARLDSSVAFKIQKVHYFPILPSSCRQKSQKHFFWKMYDILKGTMMRQVHRNAKVIIAHSIEFDKLIRELRSDNLYRPKAIEIITAHKVINYNNTNG